MDVRLLGALSVTIGGQSVPISAPRERTLLASLAAHVGRAVSAEKLMSYVWGDAAPKSAAKTLQVYVSHLRRALGAEAIETAPGGYRLAIDANSVDAGRFEQLLHRARRARAEGRLAEAIEALRSASALWSGPVVPELSSTIDGRALATRLEELRRQADEDLAEARLESGDDDGLVAELAGVVAGDPLRERSWALLMLALYRTGRQGEALDAYQEARRQLVGILGLEPGSELRRLEKAILEQDPLLDATRPAATPWSPPHPPGLAPAERFVGRADQLARLLAEHKRVIADQVGRLVMVTGEAGVGKTALAAQFGSRAHADGAVVLYGRCEREPGLPYQPWVDALDAWGRAAPIADLELIREDHGDVVNTILPGVRLRFVEPWSETTSEQSRTRRRRVFDAVADVLSTAARRPVVLVLDDLQWGSEATLLLLRDIIRRATPALVLGLWRDTDVGGTASGLLYELAYEPNAVAITLEGLSVEEVSALAGSDSEVGDDRVPAEILHRRTAGNPLFVTSLLAMPPGVSVADDRALTATIDERLRGLSTDALAVVAIAAVIGSSCDLALLGAVAPRRASVADAVGEAVIAGIIRRRTDDVFDFTHDLVREVLVASHTATDRAEVHARTGDALERLRGGDPGADAALAHHFLAAASVGRGSDGARYSLAAARAAIRGAAFEEAVTHCERGLRGLEFDDTPDEVLRADLYLAIAEARLAQPNPSKISEAAMRAAVAARRANAVDRLARAAVLHTEGAVYGTPDVASVELCEEALRQLDDRTPLRAEVLGSLAFTMVVGEGRIRDATLLAAEAVRIAEASGDHRALLRSQLARGVALLGTANVEELSTTAEAVLRSARRTEDPFGWMWGVRLRAVARLQAGDVAGFDRDASTLSDWATAEARSLAMGWASVWRAMRALLDGPLGDADALVLDVGARSAESPNLLNAFTAQLFYLRREQDRLDEIRPLIADAVLREPEIIGFRVAAATAEAALGSLDAARFELSRLGAGAFAAIPRDLSWPGVVSLLAELAVQVHDRAAASSLRELLLPHHGQLLVVANGVVSPGAADRFIAMLCGAVGAHDEADGLFVAAADQEARAGCKAAQTRTLLAHAQFAVERGERPRAMELLALSESMARPLGLTAVLASIAEASAGH